MASLETQYKNYLNENPESDLSFEDWKKRLGENIKSEFEKMMEEIKTPEYKQKRIKENEEHLETLTMDYQLGYYVGEHIVSRYLPTLTTDMLQTRNVIEVSEEDSIENNRLDREWYSTTKYQDNWSGEEDGSKEKWDLYHQHNKMLEKKYLPNPLECVLQLIKFNDETEFKKGLRFSLWDCDMCSYNIEPENIKIEYDMEMGFTKISFQLD
jgi:chaperonin cofactor prefoldin